MNMVARSIKYQSKVLVFDGVDPQGASRAFGTLRIPCMYSNNDDAENALARSNDAPLVAEGDLKLTDIQSQFQYLRDNGSFFQSIRLVLLSTIDTDSLAIELIHQSAKNCQHTERPDLPYPIKTVLCLREHTQRHKQTCTAERNEYTPPLLSCFDMETVHSSLAKELNAPPAYHRHTMVLLATVWCLCGSDFVKMKGMRSDVAFEAVADLCKGEDGVYLLEKMQWMWQIDSDTKPEELNSMRCSMIIPITRVLNNVATRLSAMPRMAKSADHIKEQLRCQETLNMSLLKAVWCGVYWSGFQCPNEELCMWGFSCPTGSVVGDVEQLQETPKSQYGSLPHKRKTNECPLEARYTHSECTRDLQTNKQRTWSHM